MPPGASRTSRCSKTVFFRDSLWISDETSQQWQQFAHGESVDGRLPKAPERLGRVAHQDNVIWAAERKQFIQVAGDHYVQVQKQHRSLQIRQLPVPQAHLWPDSPRG